MESWTILVRPSAFGRSPMSGTVEGGAVGVEDAPGDDKVAPAAAPEKDTGRLIAAGKAEGIISIKSSNDLEMVGMAIGIGKRGD